MKRHQSAYKHGVDVLGDGIGDIASFIPALGIVSKLVGGGTSGTPAATVSPGTSATPAASAATKGLVDEAVRQALVQQKAQAMAEADAAKTKKLLYGVLAAVGVVGVGGTIFFMTRRR